MLNLWRRHLTKCRHSTRKHNKCSCPIWVQGTLHGEWMKKSLGIRNWESAQKIVRDWEARAEGGTISVAQAFAQFISDGEARHLKLETLGKYRLFTQIFLMGKGVLRSGEHVGTAEMRHQVLRVPRGMGTFCEGSYCFRVSNAVDKLYVGSSSL